MDTNFPETSGSRWPKPNASININPGYSAAEEGADYLAVRSPSPDLPPPPPALLTMDSGNDDLPPPPESGNQLRISAISSSSSDNYQQLCHTTTRGAPDDSQATTASSLASFGGMRTTAPTMTNAGMLSSSTDTYVNVTNRPSAPTPSGE